MSERGLISSWLYTNDTAGLSAFVAETISRTAKLCICFLAYTTTVMPVYKSL